MRSGTRQVVTGNVVNRKVSYGAAKVREIRREALEAVKTGDADALRTLYGRIAHAGSVCASQGRRLRAFMEKLAGS